MILSSARFELSSSGLLHWAATRLAIYAVGAAIIAVSFVGVAAFYSFVWPAPPLPLVTPQSFAPTIPAPPDPGKTLKNLFAPNSVESISSLSLSPPTILSASIIVLNKDGRSYSTVGSVIDWTKTVGGAALMSFPSRYELKVITIGSPVSNEFGLGTPAKYELVSNDLSWYLVRSPNGNRILAVATDAQISAAMAKAVKK